MRAQLWESQQTIEAIRTGLASARRTIERHGGRAWAKSTVGHGATFYFTLNVRETP